MVISGATCLLPCPRFCWRTRRGPGGGYYLGADADQITIADILCAVDDWVESTVEIIRQKGSIGQPCTTRALWEDLSQQIFGLLADITLYDLVRRGEKLEAERIQSRSASANTLALANLTTPTPNHIGRAPLL
jgi:DNA-binding IscR family transcriptional regulator